MDSVEIKFSSVLPPIEKTNSICRFALDVKKKLDFKVAQISRRTLLALGAVICSFAYAVVTFYAFSITSTLLTGLIVSSAMEGVILVIQRSQGHKINIKDLGEKAAAIGTVSTANMADLGGVGIYAHELGHAAMAKACIPNISPVIHIFPFKRGCTQFQYMGALTNFGKWLGENSAFLLIASGGILATITVSLLCFGIGNKLKGSYPRLSQFMTGFGINRTANELFYGISSYKVMKGDLTHDFIYLWRMGKIPRYLPISLLAGVLTIGVYHYTKNRLAEAAKESGRNNF